MGGRAPGVDHAATGGSLSFPADQVMNIRKSLQVCEITTLGCQAEGRGSFWDPDTRQQIPEAFC